MNVIGNIFTVPYNIFLLGRILIYLYIIMKQREYITNNNYNWEGNYE